MIIMKTIWNANTPISLASKNFYHFAMTIKNIFIYLYFSFFVKAVISEAPLPASKEHLSHHLYFCSPCMSEEDLELKRSTQL